MKQTLETLLQRGINQLRLNLNNTQQQQLLNYIELLQQWNKTFNLTAITHPKDILSKHIMDSLAILPWITHKGNSIDVGTGAGIPGLILAIAHPQQSWTLLDSNGKKTRFLTQATYELNLSNTTVVQSRVEQYQAPTQFVNIVTRAYSSIDVMLSQTAHLGGQNSQWLAMKGTEPILEQTSLPCGFKVVEKVPISVPGLRADRHLVIINKV